VQRQPHAPGRFRLSPNVIRPEYLNAWRGGHQPTILSPLVSPAGAIGTAAGQLDFELDGWESVLQEPETATFQQVHRRKILGGDDRPDALISCLFR
jgi:hypothetical protein